LRICEATLGSSTVDAGGGAGRSGGVRPLTGTLA
jgi:hypothetical protein